MRNNSPGGMEKGCRFGDSPISQSGSQEGPLGGPRMNRVRLARSNRMSRKTLFALAFVAVVALAAPETANAQLFRRGGRGGGSCGGYATSGCGGYASGCGGYVGG